MLIVAYLYQAISNRTKVTDTLFMGDDSVIIFFASLLKKVHSARKEFAPLWSKFFPCRVGPIQKVDDVQERKHEVLEVIALEINDAKSS